MNNTLGDNIKTLRENKGLTQDGLAQLLREQYGQDTVRTTVIRWETGESEPKLNMLKCLSKIFGKSMDEIAGDAPIQALSQERKFLVDFVMSAESCQIAKCIKIMSIISEEEIIPHAEDLKEVAKTVIAKKV